MDPDTIITAWQVFHAASGGLKYPVTEADYDKLHALADHLTSHYNCAQEPYESLFLVVTGFMHEWELKNQPELKRLDLLEHKGFIGTAEYSADDAVFHGKLLKVRDLVGYEATTVDELKAAFAKAVDDYLEYTPDA